ncbi:hypothetical protein F5Y16DRAFT_84573 [Xylariaceae sp. FL0255]|nr:hypothetical protein F5Y16DRAFT_84573 [Xylariaceae sp. FL0255]
MASNSGWAPLSFSRAMEGHPITSPSSILFTIPSEILQSIISYVASDPANLASLALVNSACRQLARSHQYSAIALTLNHKTLGPLSVLQKEAAQLYRSSNGMTNTPSLGACVRRLYVGFMDSLQVVQGFVPGELTAGSNESDQSKRDWVIARRVTDFLDAQAEHLHWPAVQLVIPTLNNLRYLDLSNCVLDNGLLECLAGLPITALILNGTVPIASSMRPRNLILPLRFLRITVNLPWNLQVPVDSTSPLP